MVAQAMHLPSSHLPDNHNAMDLARLRRLLPLLVPGLIVATQTSCFKDVDIYTAGTEVTEDGEIIEKPRLVNLSRFRDETAAPGPKVYVDHLVHDFGRLDPLTKHEHTFVITNRGNAPLELTEGPTTCKCTVANLTAGSVPPGGKATVALQWNTGRDTEYSHSATIYTNDPAQPIIRLKIKGQVEVLLRCEPAELVFSRVAPGETPTASTLVYSQAWDEFEIDSVTSSVPGVVHHLEKATDEEMQSIKAQAAYRLTVTLPDDLPAGYFTIPMQITAHATSQQAETEETSGRGPARSEADLELLLQGKVLRRLAVYGPAVDVEGTIMMGRIPQGRGASVKLLLKMRDRDTELNVQSIKTLPASLDVRLEPHRVDGDKDDKDMGLYHLYVDLPKEAPSFRMPPGEHGFIHIEFDHPRVPRLELPVDLIVLPTTDLGR